VDATVQADADLLDALRKQIVPVGLVELELPVVKGDGVIELHAALEAQGEDSIEVSLSDGYETAVVDGWRDSELLVEVPDEAAREVRVCGVVVVDLRGSELVGKAALQSGRSLGSSDWVELDDVQAVPVLAAMLSPAGVSGRFARATGAVRPVERGRSRASLAIGQAPGRWKTASRGSKKERSNVTCGPRTVRVT
jgi:hypothetical protein